MKPRSLENSIQTNVLCIIALALFILPVLPCYAAALPTMHDKGVIAVSINPDPDVYPSLNAWLHSRKVAFITGTFPEVPGLIFDVCAYEAGGGSIIPDLIGVSVPGDNTIVTRHSIRENPGLIHVTTFTAEPGAVDVVAHLELDPEIDPDKAVLPKEVGYPNMCWALQRSTNFVGGGDPINPETVENYPDWISRCFLFTDKKVSFLDKLDRPKTNEVPEDDFRNMPGGWSMHYIGVWQKPGPQWWPNTSADRYNLPLVGAVSRDGKYLTALVCKSSTYVAQAWHTCLHHGQQWEPADAPLLERTWRMKLYAMENNPDALLVRVKKDFPGIEKLQEKRVE